MSMSLYRCAACGSPNVIAEKENGGYSYTKGAIGTVVLGVGGAVAGINGKTKQVFKCPDCGLTLNEPMVFELQNLIDIGVSSSYARKNLVLQGTKISWEFLKNKYKNIENGFADEEIKLREEHPSTIKESASQAARIIADSIIEDYQRFQAELTQLENSKENMEEMQSVWEQTAKDILEARQKAYSEAEEAEQKSYNCAVIKAEADIDKEISDLAEKYKQLEIKTKQLQEEFSSLGFFKGKRKKEINGLLQQKNTEMNSNKAKQSELFTKRSNVGIDLQKEMNRNVAKQKKEINKKYPLTESPAETKEKLLKKQAYLNAIREKQIGIQKAKALSCIVVYKFIEFMSSNAESRISVSQFNEESKEGNLESFPASNVIEVYDMLKEKLSEILNTEVSALPPFNGQRIALCLRELVNNGALSMEEIKCKKYYYISK